MGAEKRSFTLLTTTFTLKVEPTVGVTMGGSKRTVGGPVGFVAPPRPLALGAVAFACVGKAGFSVTPVLAGVAWPKELGTGCAAAAVIGVGDCGAAPPPLPRLADPGFGEPGFVV